MLLFAAVVVVIVLLSLCCGRSAGSKVEAAAGALHLPSLPPWHFPHRQVAAAAFAAAMFLPCHIQPLRVGALLVLTL
jgi:hypothetical protein